jgi:anti-anti-sigma factor
MADALRGNALDPLEIVVTAEGARAVVTLHGYAAAEHGKEVEEKLAKIPASTREVIVDVRRVTYIDSAMLATLSRFTDNMNGAGVQVSLATGESVSRVLTREKLDNHFPVVDMTVPAQPAAAEA